MPAACNNFGSPARASSSPTRLHVQHLHVAACAACRERMRCVTCLTLDMLGRFTARRASTIGTTGNALPQRQDSLSGSQALDRGHARPLGGGASCAEPAMDNASTFLIARPKHLAVPSNSIHPKAKDAEVVGKAGSLLLASSLRLPHGPRRTGAPSN